jgi:hypothetical protein
MANTIDTTDTVTTFMYPSQRDAVPTPEGHAPSACCGGPAPAGTDACCVRDAAVKSSGGTGCGCASEQAAPITKKTACCG